MDYGKTLHLPQTDFPMRGNLPKREPDFLKFWQDNKIYEKRLKKRDGAPKFILHDGPPYANGKIHIGHALNKVLKDIILKYKTQQGCYTKYVPGWDTHGLPIEHAVIKDTGLNRHEMAPLDLRAKCRDYALARVEEQKKDFIRLGVLGDWDHPYLTLRKPVEVAQIGVFGEMAKKGYIYKGLKTVYWCPHCETALAEAEIEYKDDKSFSIYVKFKSVDLSCHMPKGADPDKVFALIWTTTPWTIPCNVAISANENFEYVWVRIGDEYLLMAKDLVEPTMKAGKVDDYEVLPDVMTGKQLEGLVFKHPFYDRKVPIMLRTMARTTLMSARNTLPGASSRWARSTARAVTPTRSPALKASSSSIRTYRSSRNWLNWAPSLPRARSAISIRTAGAARNRSSTALRNSGSLRSTASARKPSMPSTRSNGFRPGAMTAFTI